MVLIFLVFFVVVFGGARDAHLFNFLCCSIWWWVRGAYHFSFLCCGIWWGSVVIILFGFCVVVFGGGGSVVLTFLVFCVVVFGGTRGAHLFSFLCCSIRWWVRGAQTQSYLKR